MHLVFATCLLQFKSCITLFPDCVCQPVIMSTRQICFFSQFGAGMTRFDVSVLIEMFIMTAAEREAR